MDQRGRGGWRGGGGDRGRGGRTGGGEASGRGQGAWQTAASSGRGGGGGQFYGGQGERGRGGGGQFYGGQGGRGGGGGRGGPPPARGGHEGGRGHAPRASSSTNSGSQAGPLALQLSKLQIKPPDVVQGKRVPMRCPDNGGTLSISSLNLSVNHFRLTFDKTFSVLHYEIDIKLENNSGPSVDEKISKSDMAAIKKHIFKDRASSLPDDGGRYIFSPVKLQEGKFKVTVHGTSYLVSVVLQKRLSIGDLASAPYPREILQGLDVIMRMNSARSCIQVGKNFFMPNRSTDLGYGAAALQGFQQSIKPTENGLVVCVDYTVMAFRKPMPVIDFLLELGFNINEQTQLHGRDRAEVERTLKNMRVNVIHRRCSQKFQVQGLTSKNASEITFLDETLNKQRYLLDYFRETYHIDIKYRMLPCLSLSKTKTNYVPMELCQIIEGQLFPKDKLSRDGNMTLKNMALISSKRRLDAIQNMINSEDGPCRGRILDEFHLTVRRDMTDVTARVLQRPTLKLLNSNGNASKFDIPNNDCQWNLLNNKVLRGKPIDYWAVLDFSKRRRPGRYDRYFDVNDFIPAFVKRFSDLGIVIERKPLFVEQSAFDVLSDPDSLRQTLLKCKKNGGDRLQILLCPMLDRHEGYKTLKLICETELGIVTQCFLPLNIKGMDQYLANLALKINAKLGGCNFELFDSLPGVNPNCPILFIGADVNHPSGRNNLSPSIAAVVASTNWPELNNYASIVQAQKRRHENIVDIGRMCKQLLDNFARINRVRPQHIIYFRDGVSDGQFDMVLNQELTDIKEAIESADYKPMITVVVAQKRHQTRLFPKNMNPNMRTCNVPPGTVVDKGITAPIGFNFFLCSHNGMLGTSKPTHYYVLWDEFGYTSNGIQQLIYNMCFTFARCTKPVSLVPPVYYADLLAYRGRMYYEGMMGMSSSASCSSASSSSAAELVKLPELHVAIRGGMFFL